MREQKTLYTLDLGYPAAITDLTFPLMRHYADKIGADFVVIGGRRFPGWPVVYEKLQIFELAQEAGNDWSLYLDADALVHPETIDFTAHLAKDTVAHNGADMAAIRWTYDRYFRRDGRNIGSCNWLAIASDWCVDLWRPLSDLSLEEAVARIRPTVDERNTVITAEHLVDDFTLSRNIAQYGLKFTTVKQLLPAVGLPDAVFFWHVYTLTPEEKVVQMRQVLQNWKVPDQLLDPYRRPEAVRP